LIPILGHRLPERAPWELGPPPLTAVPVPIAEEEIDEAGLEERAIVDPVRAGLEARIEILVADDVGQAESAGTVAARLRRELPVEPDGASELLLELAQDRVVRENDELPGLRVDARFLGDRARDELRRWILRRHLVVDDVLDHGS